MKPGHIIVLLPLFFAICYAQSIRLYNFTTADGFNLSTACLNVLNQNITCDSSLEVVLLDDFPTVTYTC